MRKWRGAATAVAGMVFAVAWPSLALSHAAPGAEPVRTHVTANGLVADLYVPADAKGRTPAVIVLGGSVADIPHSLLDQLKIGGRLGAVVGDEPVMCATFITRTSATDFRTTQPWDCDAPRLQNFAEKSRFTF